MTKPFVCDDHAYYSETEECPHDHGCPSDDDDIETCYCNHPTAKCTIATHGDFKTRAAAFWAELKQLEEKYGVRLEKGLTCPIVSDAQLKSKGVEP